MATPVYHVGSLPPIKYRLSAITLNSLFLEQARALLRSICLVWLVFEIVFLWRRIIEALFSVKFSEKYWQNVVIN